MFLFSSDNYPLIKNLKMRTKFYTFSDIYSGCFSFLESQVQSFHKVPFFSSPHVPALRLPCSSLTQTLFV